MKPDASIITQDGVRCKTCPCGDGKSFSCLHNRDRVLSMITGVIFNFPLARTGQNSVYFEQEVCRMRERSGTNRQGPLN